MSLTPEPNLPPVSTSVTANVIDAGVATGVVDIGGKFAASVLPPVVHLDLQISPQIFWKIQNDPYVIFRGLGEDDSFKTWRIVPLKLCSICAQQSF